LEAPVWVDHGISSAPNAQLWVAVAAGKKFSYRSIAPTTTENWARGVVQDIAYMGDTSVLVRLTSGKVCA